MTSIGEHHDSDPGAGSAGTSDGGTTAEKGPGASSETGSGGAAGQHAGERGFEDSQDEERNRLSLRHLLGSVMAAALGVQSSRNRERDFRQGRALTFIVAGIVFTGLFIGGVLAVVKLVLATR